MGTYRERYAYDAAGNILRLTHLTGGSAWTRDHVYAEPGLLDGGAISNRLTATRTGAGPDEPYQSSTTNSSSLSLDVSLPFSGSTGYQWAIGTSPGASDVMAFTAVGSATSASLKAAQAVSARSSAQPISGSDSGVPS
jgi:hypothetical protein